MLNVSDWFVIWILGVPSLMMALLIWDHWRNR